MRARNLLVPLLVTAACTAACTAPSAAPASLDPAVLAFPQDAQVRIRRARLRRDQGSIDAAADDYRAALAIDPGAEGMAAELAVMLAAAGRGEPARAVLEGAGLPGAWLAAGKELWDTGRRDPAFEVWQAG